MRVHIELEDALVDRIDERAGARGRSAFIRRAIHRMLEQDQRWELIESALGGIADAGHDWDADPAAWVRDSRRADGRRVG